MKIHTAAIWEEILIARARKKSPPCVHIRKENLEAVIFLEMVESVWWRERHFSLWKKSFHSQFWQVERNGCSMYLDEKEGCVQVWKRKKIEHESRGRLWVAGCVNAWERIIQPEKEEREEEKGKEENGGLKKGETTPLERGICSHTWRSFDKSTHQKTKKKNKKKGATKGKTGSVEHNWEHEWDQLRRKGNEAVTLEKYSGNTTAPPRAQQQPDQIVFSRTIIHGVVASKNIVEEALALVKPPITFVLARHGFLTENIHAFWTSKGVCQLLPKNRPPRRTPCTGCTERDHTAHRKRHSTLRVAAWRTWRRSLDSLEDNMIQTAAHWFSECYPTLSVSRLHLMPHPCISGNHQAVTSTSLPSHRNSEDWPPFSLL